MLKLKPIELYEIENIASSDTFTVHDCATGKTSEIVGGWREAKKLVMNPDNSLRLLVYAYNKERTVRSNK